MNSLTIGMKGASATDKNNWRHFYNVFGAGSASRPLLTVEYVLPPDPIQAVRLRSADLLSTGTYTYTNTLRPTVRATLPATTYCPTNDPCYRARFEVWNDAGTQRYHTLYSPVGAGGEVVSVQIPTDLANDTVYKVRVWTENTAYWLESATHLTLGPKLRTWTAAPVVPVASPTEGTITSGSAWSTSVSTTSELVTKWCLAETTITDQNLLTGCTTTGSQSVSLTTPVLTVGSGRQEIKHFYAWVCYVTGECAHTGDLTVVVNEP